MQNGILEFASLGHWVDQLLYLEMHPEICSQESLGILAQFVSAIGDMDLVSPLGWNYLLARYASENGIDEIYKYVFLARSSPSKGFEAWLHDYQMWQDDLRALHRAAQRLQAMNKHYARACRLALELGLVSEGQPEAMASTLARWSLATLHLPEIPTRDGFEECLQRLAKAEEIARRSENTNLLSPVLYGLGVAQYRGFCWGYVADLESAIPPLQSALESANGDHSLAAIHVELGQVLSFPPLRYDPRQLEQAISHLKQAIGLAEPLGDMSLLGTAHWRLGQAYFHRQVDRRLKNLEKSIYHYDEACRLNQIVGNRLEEGQVALELAAVYVNMAATDQTYWTKAKDIYDKWREFFSEDRFPAEVAQIHHGLGLLYAPNDDHRSGQDPYLALEHYQKAQTLSTGLGRPDILAPVLGAMGALYATAPLGDRSERLAKARSCFDQALALVGDREPQRRGTLLHDLGLVYIDLPSGDRFTNLETAREILTQALSIRTPDRFPLQYADTLEALGGVHAQLSERGAGPPMFVVIEEFQEALRWRTQLDTPLACASCKEKLATALTSSASRSESETLLSSIRLFREAIEGFLDYGDKFKYAHAHANMARAYIRLRELGMANQDDVVTAYGEAIRVYCVDTWPVERRRTLRDLGVVFLKDRDWQQAHKVFEEAISITEGLYETATTTYARHGELAEVLDLYSCDAYVLARIGQLAEAVERLENSRGRALVDSLRLRRADLESLDPAHRATFQNTVQRIGELETEIGLLSVSLESQSGRPYHDVSYQLGELRQQLGRFDHTLTNATCKFDEIASLSDPVAPSVYLTITPIGSMAIIVRHGIAEIPPEDVIWLDSYDAEAVRREFLGWYGGPSIILNLWNTERGALGEPLERFLAVLGRDVMTPLCNRLIGLGYQSMHLVACQDLSSMPLHAARLASGEWVDQVLRIIYVACVRSARWRKPFPTTQSLLAVAPSEPGLGGTANDHDLAFTIPEVEETSRYFDRCHLLIGGRVTKRDVLRHLTGSYSHIHFACHGRFVPHAVNTSMLSLGGDETLSLADLYSASLDTQLVVLSACQMALASLRSAVDELIGFPSALLAAGVQGVIAAQWPVADVASAILLAAFYRYHIRKRLEPAAALCEAQHWLRTATAAKLDLVGWYERAYEGRALTSNTETRIQYYRAHPDEKPFEQPYFWAAYTYTSL